MMNLWALVALVSGGIFVGGLITLAWDRLPAWQRMQPDDFQADFAGVVHRADRVQPVLLLIALGATVGFAITTGGSLRILTSIGAFGLLAALVGSVAILVPLQGRMVSLSSAEVDALDGLRRRWFMGHLGRTVVAAASFLLVASAAAM